MGFYLRVSLKSLAQGFYLYLIDKMEHDPLQLELVITPDKVRNLTTHSEQHSPASTSRRRSSLKKPSDRVFGLSSNECRSPGKMPRRTTFG